MLTEPEAQNVWSQGSLHIVVSISNIRADQLNIQPPVADELTEGVEVIVVQLENVHEFVFMFYAVVAALKNRPPATALQAVSRGVLAQYSEGDTAPAFAAWMGIGAENPTTHLWSDLLGADRGAVIRFAEEELRLRLTHNQAKVITSLSGVVAVIKNFAGGGKTTLLSILVLFILKRIRQEEYLCSLNQASASSSVSGVSAPPLVFFLSTTKQVVRDFVANLKEYGHHDAIAMMGADDEEGDLFQAHLQKATRDLMQTFNSMYEKLDAMLSC